MTSVARAVAVYARWRELALEFINRFYGKCANTGETATGSAFRRQLLLVADSRRTRHSHMQQNTHFFVLLALVSHASAKMKNYLND